MIRWRLPAPSFIHKVSEWLLPAWKQAILLPTHTHSAALSCHNIHRHRRTDAGLGCGAGTGAKTKLSGASQSGTKIHLTTTTFSTTSTANSAGFASFHTLAISHRENERASLQNIPSHCIGGCGWSFVGIVWFFAELLWKPSIHCGGGAFAKNTIPHNVNCRYCANKMYFADDLQWLWFGYCGQTHDYIREYRDASSLELCSLFPFPSVEMANWINSKLNTHIFCNSICS